MSSRLLNEVNEIKKMMGLITETEKSDAILDLRSLSMLGGIKLFDRNSNDITKRVHVAKNPYFVEIYSKRRQFDYNEFITIKIKGLNASKATLHKGDLSDGVDLKIFYRNEIVIPFSIHDKDWWYDNKIVAIDVLGNVPKGEFRVLLNLDFSEKSGSFFKGDSY